MQSVSFLGGSQWGGGIYGYRLKFWLFYGYRLFFFQLRFNFFCFKELNINEPVFFLSLKRNEGFRMVNKIDTEN